VQFCATNPRQTDTSADSLRVPEVLPPYLARGSTMVRYRLLSWYGTTSLLA